MLLFLGRIRCLRPSFPLPLTRCTRLASPPTPTPTPNLSFASEYLVQSCGLSSDEALKASKYIRHLKSPHNPDAVLQFLREIGMSESDLRTAVSLDARILCSGVETNWRPNIAKLQEIGIPIEDISGIIARRPYLFRYNFAPKVEFWIQALRSTEFVPVILYTDASLLSSSLENVLIPNLSFLKDQCGLSTNQIIRLIKSNARMISLKPDLLKRQVERAEELGVARSSGTFVHALIIVGYLNQGTINARLNNLTSFGFSPDNAKLMISKVPFLLNTKEHVLTRKLEFLIKERYCDMSHLVTNPSLLTYSLENRLIPRSLVWKILVSKGFAVENLKLATLMKPNDEEFVRKYVLPYEHSFPGLHRAYADAGKIRELISFISYLTLILTCRIGHCIDDLII